MRKIAILTLNGYYNYGNRLQNYSTQELLKSFGFSVETVLVDLSQNKNAKTTFERIKRFTLKKLNKIVIQILSKKLMDKKVHIFKSFTMEYIVETGNKISDDRIPFNFSKRYDYFITGSDQVWNPKNIKGSSIYFLTFAPKYKRIAYAPSFGVSSIPDQYIENYKRWLTGIPYLSVREESGAKIIKELTGRDVPVLVDPTLMLTREKWLSIAKEDPYKPDKPYLLTYFLGEIPKGTRKRIKKIARDYNLEIVRLADTRDKKRYIAGPGEFIDYINSADLVCTDSFHGSVFSILMETPFIVFDRVGTSMYSRIETLLNKFNLHSRQANYIKDDEIFNIDFSHIPPILDEERKKALNYLKEALNVKDNN